MMLLFMMVSIILWPKWWFPILFVFRLLSLTLLTNNLFTTEKCTELTSYRTNLERFWIALGDDKSVFEQMSYFKRYLARIRLRTTACHDCASCSFGRPVSLNRERYS